MTGIYDVNKLEKLGDDSPLYDPNNTRKVLRTSSILPASRFTAIIR